MYFLSHKVFIGFADGDLYWYKIITKKNDTWKQTHWLPQKSQWPKSHFHYTNVNIYPLQLKLQELAQSNAINIRILSNCERSSILKEKNLQRRTNILWSEPSHAHAWGPCVPVPSVYFYSSLTRQCSGFGLTSLCAGQDLQSFMTIYLSLQVSGSTQADPQPLSQLLICLYGFFLCVKLVHNSITVRVTKLSPECHKWLPGLMAASR